jgi:ATP-dependent Clp protease ATP-binding subunit ClpA
MKVCKIDLGALKGHLASYIDHDLKNLVMDDGGESRPTAAFQRVVARAVGIALGRGRPTLTGAELLVGIFFETQSPAARLLGEQDMVRQDAVNFIIHGIEKGGGKIAV